MQQQQVNEMNNPFFYTDPYMEIIGYTPTTTFWTDFSIAEPFGLQAVQDTFDRAFEEWKREYKYLTELVMVLNHKCNIHYELENYQASELYETLYYQLRDYALDKLKDKELDYFIETTD